ncbi:MAG: cyclopropane-fatty-acyl-phospholipid synthase family protein, partial [bacterium]|nr:cyclopropane-fatty-acyl-phospholipid synthase family protein [bacterium]
DAQKNKLRTVILKARNQASDHVLEIGSGWGGFAMEAVRQTGCRVTTLTLSTEQKALAEQRIAEAGLADRIEVKLCDYRHMQGQFDKIISIEMIEAVGHEFLGAYFQQLDRLLKPDGLVVIQAITIPDQRYDLYRKEGDWLQKYIFPGAVVPSLQALVNAMTRHSSLMVESLENIGPHYAPTLAAWRERLHTHKDAILALGFDTRFFRMWNYYFSYCEAGFATRTLNDLHLVLTRPNNKSLR